MATDKQLAGLLFDFAGFLTTRTPSVTLGSSDDATVAVDLVKEFAAARGLSLEDAAVTNWNESLDKGR